LTRFHGAVNGAAGRKRFLRWTALVACVLFAAAMLFSLAYLHTHAHHIHDHNAPGGTCAACIRLRSAARLLETLSLAAVSAVSAAVALRGSRRLRKAAASDHPINRTLVSLSIRLNN